MNARRLEIEDRDIKAITEQYEQLAIDKEEFVAIIYAFCNEVIEYCRTYGDYKSYIPSDKTINDFVKPAVCSPGGKPE